MVGDVACAEPELADAVVDGCLLKDIRRLVFHKHGLNDPFHILTPELRAFFFCLIEGNLLGHANNLHIGQCNNLVFHIFSYDLTQQRYTLLLLWPNIWDILHNYVMSSEIGGGDMMQLSELELK